MADDHTLGYLLEPLKVMIHDDDVRVYYIECNLLSAIDDTSLFTGMGLLYVIRDAMAC